jgi:hypothetical protein
MPDLFTVNRVAIADVEGQHVLDRNGRWKPLAEIATAADLDGIIAFGDEAAAWAFCHGASRTGRRCKPLRLEGQYA